MQANTKHAMSAEAGVHRKAASSQGIDFRNFFEVECHDRKGELKWVDKFENLVVDAGLNYALGVAIAGQAAIAQANWYVGLTDGTPTVAAADTMASHSGWVEVQNYDESNRPHYNLPNEAVTGKSVSNSANKAEFTISADNTTVGGAFIVGGSGTNAKGGATGTLYGAGAFSGGDKSVDDGDTLTITITCTTAAS